MLLQPSTTAAFMQHASSFTSIVRLLTSQTNPGQGVLLQNFLSSSATIERRAAQWWAPCWSPTTSTILTSWRSSATRWPPSGGTHSYGPSRERKERHHDANGRVVVASGATSDFFASHFLRYWSMPSCHFAHFVRINTIHNKCVIALG